jgi:hypothetical protein
MPKCKQCNSKLKRIHRTFLERFRYLATYECPKCETEEFVPRPIPTISENLPVARDVEAFAPRN